MDPSFRGVPVFTAAHFKTMATLVDHVCSYFLIKCSFFSLLVLSFILMNVNCLSIRKYGTKTIYNASFSENELYERDKARSYHPHFCQPVHLDVLLRHGIRNPGRKDIDRVNNLHSRILKQLDSTSFSDFFEWKNRFSSSAEKDIVDIGKREHITIAGRFAMKYKSLLKSTKPSDVLFITSDTNRTVSSCYAFQQGLLQVGLNLSSACVKDNIRLRFFDICQNYLAIGQKGGFKTETDLFKESDEFNSMVENMKKRHYIPEWFEIKSGESTWSRTKSPIWPALNP